ncbi:unnamed protein product [Rotaria sp. Silwood2]|nr:unnamed protein product [Rotaria sp. Silwood2]
MSSTNSSKVRPAGNNSGVDDGTSPGKDNTGNPVNIEIICRQSEDVACGNTTSIISDQEVKLDDKKRNSFPSIPKANLSQDQQIPSTSINPESGTNTSQPIKIKVIILSIFVSIIAILIKYGFFPSLDACNMKKAENRDFNEYYGIVNFKNHFTITSADECDSSIIFKPALPQTILKPDHLPSSFLILTSYGTGKTLLRCEYFKSLQSNNYFKVLILNKEISEYLERFVKETAMSRTDCDMNNCIMKWSKNEFGQLLISLLVTQFVDTFEKEEWNIPDLSLDEKIELITIICYYYNQQHVKKLEKFVNYFLEKTNDTMYITNNTEAQLKEHNVFHFKPLFAHFKNDIKNLSAVRPVDDKLLLLFEVVEGEGFVVKALEITTSSNVFNDLRHFALFMKNHVRRTPVSITDGIDENRFFFVKNQVNKKSLELFCNSTLAQEIIAMVMAHNFYLSIFYRKLNGINIEDTIIQRDKFPILTIRWNTKSLFNYADYVLQEMNKNASSSRCKSFSDFKTLVNYGNKKNAEIIDRIPTPRALHFFMSKLITEMNDNASDAQTPFIATLDNVHNAFQNSYEFLIKVTTL